MPSTPPNEAVRLTPAISPSCVSIHVSANTVMALSACRETRGQPLRKVRLQSPNQFSCSQSVQSLSLGCLLASSWTVAHQAPLSMEFSRQEYWSGSHSLLQGNHPDLRNELGSPALQAESLLSKPPGKPRVNKSPSLIGLSRR